MTRKLITWAAATVAVVSVTFATADVEARQCRNHRRSRCCHQMTTCASTANACCTPQPACSNGQLAPGTAPAAYDAPQSTSYQTSPTPVVAAPAPAPGT